MIGLALLLAGCGPDLDPRAQGVWQVDLAAVAQDSSLSPAARQALRTRTNPLVSALRFEFGPRTFTVRSAHGVQTGRFKVEQQTGDTSVLLAHTRPPQRLSVTVVNGGLRLVFDDRTLPLIPAPEAAR